MPKRIPLGTIGVTRDNKTVYPKIGQLFDFTADEVAQINALEKSSGNKLFRKPVNEDQSAGPTTAPLAASDKVDYSKKTVPELKEIAASREIDLGEATKKDDIVALLVAADTKLEEEEL